MAKRGLMTEKERTLMVNSQVSATSRHNVVLMWLFRTAIDARKAGKVIYPYGCVNSGSSSTLHYKLNILPRIYFTGHMDGGFGFEQNILLRVEEIRAEANYMERILRARMPFSYAHIVQVLVDLVTWLYPVMAVSSGLSFQIGILGVIFLTMTYQGLFDLAKRCK